MAKHTPATIKKAIDTKVAGVWVAAHDEHGHHYRHTPTGIIVDSTTTKLSAVNKPHLQRWIVKKGIEWLEEGDRFDRLSGPDREAIIKGAQAAYTDERDAAGSTGTVVHDVTENYIKFWIANGRKPADIKLGFPENAEPRAIAAARSVEKFFNEHEIIPLASEILVGSVKRNVAGTLDFLCFLDGVLTLVDLKSSNSVTDTYACQLADYAYSWKEMTGIAIKRAVILWLSKDYDKFKVYNVPDLAGAYKAFNGISSYYDWQSNRQDKLVEDKKILVL